MKNRFINIVFFVVVMNLFQINLVNADNSLESYDMSNVKILETPFWCSMTEEERASAISNLTAEQKRVALEDGTERPTVTAVQKCTDVSFIVKLRRCENAPS